MCSNDGTLTYLSRCFTGHTPLTDGFVLVSVSSYQGKVLLHLNRYCGEGPGSENITLNSAEFEQLLLINDDISKAFGMRPLEELCDGVQATTQPLDSIGPTETCDISDAPQSTCTFCTDAGFTWSQSTLNEQEFLPTYLPIEPSVFTQISQCDIAPIGPVPKRPRTLKRQRHVAATNYLQPATLDARMPFTWPNLTEDVPLLNNFTGPAAVKPKPPRRSRVRKDKSAGEIDPIRRDGL